MDEQIKRNKRGGVEAAELLVTLAFMWILLRPDQASALREYLQRQYMATRYRASVWQAIRAIRKLPERD